nr:protein FAR1-RELATED SEQUENCE 5 [Aegilops tauschii subsp. strangulata]
MEQETGYASDDSGSDNRSSSLNANQPPGDNYMSQDESYSGNLHGNDDDEEYDIDEQFYAQIINAHGDNKHNNIDDDNVESEVDASRSGSASQGGVDGPSGNDEHSDDDQFDLDMGYNEYQQESLDRHWEVMAKTFSFSDDHNHILARPDEVPFLRSHNQIKAFERAEILAMAGAGIRKHIILDNMVSRYGWYAKSPFQRTKLYNMCYREKMKLLAQGDADTAIGIMLTRKDKDPDFFFEHTVDAEGRLQNLFSCDSQSRRDYLDYGDVVVFDSKYKMNRMPFIPFVGLNNHRCTTVFACAIVSNETEATYVWLLNTFLKANCQKRPKSVITDGDAAMIRAIRKVLSDVWHRLCSWHIEKNMQKHLNRKSLKEFRALLYYATTHKVFEERWAAFVRKWQTERTKTWLHRMYRKRTLWAASYLPGGFFLGMRSNQRSESLNSSLHLHLDYGMTIIDMIVHYENCIVCLRENEAYDDYTASQTVPGTVTECQTIESYAAKAFTHANFYMLQQDMKKVQELEVIDRLTGTDSQRFVVAWKNNRDHRFNVDSIRQFR